MRVFSGVFVFWVDLIDEGAGVGVWRGVGLGIEWEGCCG